MRTKLSTVLVTGGRDYADRQRVFDALDTMLLLYGKLLVIHGGARGVDTFAEEWAKSRQQVYFCFPAEWNEYGKRAGTLRNEEMAELGLAKDAQNYGLVFSGGRGTSHMCNLLHAAARDKPVSIWLVDGEFWK